jgi:hypothetical protein
MRAALGSRSVDQLRAELVFWRSGAVIVAATVLLGALEGVLWSRIAPGEQFFVNPDGQFGALPTESYHQFTDIAIFALIGIVVAVAVGTLSWRWRSVRGTSTVLVVAGSNALGALTAYLLGRVMVSGVDPASVGPSSVVSVVDAAATLGNVMVIIVQPAVAVAVYTFLVAWNGQQDLSRPGSISGDITQRPAV